MPARIGRGLRHRCLALICVTLLLAHLAGCGGGKQTYGVFLGIGAEDIAALDAYDIVVLEPQEFSPEEIARLRARGKTVYGYLNIGAIELFRSYYPRFSDLALGVYENWPDERWVDVSAPAWRIFLVEELGTAYVGMGFDGLFLDNADVYSHYPTDDIYLALCDILRGLKQLGTTLLVNGADEFVTRCIDEGVAGSLIDGVNQETVFTRIDFSTETYAAQDDEATAYYMDYLSRVAEAGLRVYLLEYGASPEVAERVEEYCEKNGFLWYNADGLELRAP